MFNFNYKIILLFSSILLQGNSWSANINQKKVKPIKTRQWFKKYQKTIGLACSTAATAIIVAGIVIWKRIKDNQLAAAEAEVLRQQQEQEVRLAEEQAAQASEAAQVARLAEEQAAQAEREAQRQLAQRQVAELFKFRSEREGQRNILIEASIQEKADISSEQEREFEILRNHLAAIQLIQQDVTTSEEERIQEVTEERVVETGAGQLTRWNGIVENANRLILFNIQVTREGLKTDEFKKRLTDFVIPEIKVDTTFEERFNQNCEFAIMQVIDFCNKLKREEAAFLKANVDRISLSGSEEGARLLINEEALSIVVPAEIQAFKQQNDRYKAGEARFKKFQNIAT